MIFLKKKKHLIYFFKYLMVSSKPSLMSICGSHFRISLASDMSGHLFVGSSSGKSLKIIFDLVSVSLIILSANSRIVFSHEGFLNLLDFRNLVTYILQFL